MRNTTINTVIKANVIANKANITGSTVCEGVVKS